MEHEFESSLQHHAHFNPFQPITLSSGVISSVFVSAVASSPPVWDGNQPCLIEHLADTSSLYELSADQDRQDEQDQ
jgi:hypothetical protein